MLEEGGSNSEMINRSSLSVPVQWQLVIYLDTQLAGWSRSALSSVASSFSPGLRVS